MGIVDESPISGSFGDLLNLVKSHIDIPQSPIINKHLINCKNQFSKENKGYNIGDKKEILSSGNSSKHSSSLRSNDQVNNNNSDILAKDSKLKVNNANDQKDLDIRKNELETQQTVALKRSKKIIEGLNNLGEYTRHSMIALDSHSHVPVNLSRCRSSAGLERSRVEEKRSVSSQNDLLVIEKSNQLTDKCFHQHSPRRWTTLKGIAALGRALSTSSLALRPKRRRTPLSALTVDLGDVEDFKQNRNDFPKSLTPSPKTTVQKKLRMPDARFGSAFAPIHDRRIRSVEDSLQNENHQHIGYNCKG